MKNKLTDEEVKDKIKEILNIKKFDKIYEYEPKVRNEKIRKLRIIKGTSRAQISRILGINKRMVERIMKD